MWCSCFFLLFICLCCRSLAVLCCACIVYFVNCWFCSFHFFNFIWFHWSIRVSGLPYFVNFFLIKSSLQRVGFLQIPFRVWGWQYLMMPSIFKDPRNNGHIPCILYWMVNVTCLVLIINFDSASHFWENNFGLCIC